MLSHVIMSKEGSNIVNVGNSGNGLPPDGSITINSCINSTVSFYYSFFLIFK